MGSGDDCSCRNSLQLGQIRLCRRSQLWKRRSQRRHLVSPANGLSLGGGDFLAMEVLIEPGNQRQDQAAGTSLSPRRWEAAAPGMADDCTCRHLWEDDEASNRSAG